MIIVYPTEKGIIYKVTLIWQIYVYVGMCVCIL